MSQTNPAPTLQDLVDRAVILSAEHQAHFADLGGESAWDADLEAGTLTFHSEIPLVCGAHFLGTAAPGTQSWLWGWHNVNNFPRGRGRGRARPSARRDGRDLRAEHARDPPHRRGPVPSRARGQGRDGPLHALRGPDRRGTCAWFLLTHPRFELPPASLARIARVIPEGIGSTTVADHRRAVRAYAVLRGLDIRWQDEQTAVVGAADGSATVSFDAHGRVVNLSATVTPPRSRRRSRSRLRPRPRAARAPWLVRPQEVARAGASVVGVVSAAVGQGRSQARRRSAPTRPPTACGTSRPRRRARTRRPGGP
ncbi:DUF6882 domain-containing protein [Oerskovia sp. M15]